MARQKPDVQAVIVAAGSSSRMGLGERKPFLRLGEVTVLEASCRALSRSKRVALISVVCHADDLERCEDLLARAQLPCPTRVCAGGAERTDSVRNGSATLFPGVRYLAVHDAARPAVAQEELERLFQAADEHGAALLGVWVRDTLKRVESNRAVETVPREGLFAAQTPQVFPAEKLREVLERAKQEGFQPTDESSLWERYVGPVHIVEGDARNLKLTYAKDLELVQRIMQSNDKQSSFRIGNGFDIHRLEEGRPCILGGVELPHPKGPVGHSDGDAVLHAITDALLGAAGLDDIGTLFPDTDPKFKGADSAMLLQEARAAVQAEGYSVINVDVVIATEGPRIAPHRKSMRARIAALLETDVNCINLKGKTLEGLGALAGGTGVAVQAVCLLAR